MREDVLPQQRRRVGAGRLDEGGVDPEWAQVVRDADVVHGFDQRLLDLALGRGGLAAGASDKARSARVTPQATPISLENGVRTAGFGSWNGGLVLSTER